MQQHSIMLNWLYLIKIYYSYQDSILQCENKIKCKNNKKNKKTRRGKYKEKNLRSHDFGKSLHNHDLIEDRNKKIGIIRQQNRYEKAGETTWKEESIHDVSIWRRQKARQKIMVRSVIQSTRQQLMHIRVQDRAQVLITADYRTRPKSIWKKLWLLWNMAVMHLHFLPEWQRSLF